MASAAASALVSSPPPQFSPLAPSHPLIPSLLPRHSTALLVGAAFVGKTALLLPALSDYLTRGEFLGHPAARHPDTGLPMLPRMGYLACDRTTSETAALLHDSSLPALDITHLPYISWQDSLPSIESPTLAELYRCFPEPRPQLLIVEALQALCDGKLVDYRDVMLFMGRLKRFCAQHDVTILGTVPQPKARDGEGAYRSHDRVLGTGAWVNQAAALLSLDMADEDKPEAKQSSLRRLTIRCRNRPPEILYYDFDLDHHLVPAVMPNGWRELLDGQLQSLAADLPVRTSTLLSWGAALGIGEASVEDWITEALRSGRLERVRKGMYRRAVVQ